MRILYLEGFSSSVVSEAANNCNRSDQRVATQQLCKHGLTRNNRWGCFLCRPRRTAVEQRGLCNPLLHNGSIYFRVSDRAMKAVTSSTIEMIFSVESVQSAYKRSECRSKFGSGQLRASRRLEESPEEFLVPRFQGDIARRLHSDLKCYFLCWDPLLGDEVETENPSACVTVNCKLCKSAIAQYLSVIKRTCKQGANKSKHPNYNSDTWQYEKTVKCTK
jgi:hypothetical protein